MLTVHEVLERQRARVAAVEAQTQQTTTTIQASHTDDRSRNVMRPRTFDEVVGQASAKSLMRAAVERARVTGEPVDHVLLVGPAGTGKTTFSHVIAHELDVRVFEVEAPVSFDTLMELREVMEDGDLLKLEEIHQQGIMERRGKSSATQPEVLYAVMEDRVIPTQSGILPFPRITIVGTTTDEGRLPDPFLDRFPLRPRLAPYGRDELVVIAQRNAASLGLQMDDRAADMVAGACRGVPRVVNNLVKNAGLFAFGYITTQNIEKVLEVNGIAADGLTPDMQAMLKFLRYRGARTVKGEVRYQASVGTIATAIGKSRDSKAINLRVEPFLIEQGYVQVAHGGRLLTDAGIARAEALA